jgi:hypothetical protein
VRGAATVNLAISALLTSISGAPAQTDAAAAEIPRAFDAAILARHHAAHLFVLAWLGRAADDDPQIETAFIGKRQQRRVEGADTHPDEVRRTQVTFLKLPEPVAMATDMPVYSPVVTAVEVQFWLDACKHLGVTKGTLTVDDVLAK